MDKKLREELIETAREMNRCGINQGMSGNVSVRAGDGFLITPSGRPYTDLSAEDIVHLDSDGRVEGPGKPSSEWRIHCDLYQARRDAGAILHAHPTHCTALACMHKAIPAFHYTVAVAGGSDIPCAPYATFGTAELSHHVLDALEGRKACLMANHGLICLASGLTAALALAIEVEQLAQIYLACLAVGSPVLLDQAEMARVLERFKDYGSS